MIIAINPAKNLAESRNTQRSHDVHEIGSAVTQYTIDNNGNLPASITTTQTNICATTGASCTGLIDLGVLTANGTYLKAMLSDPKTGTATDSHYTIIKDANNHITITAPDAELGKTIQFQQ